MQRTFAVLLALSVGLLGAAVAHNFGLLPVREGTGDEEVARHATTRPMPPPTSGTGSPATGTSAPSAGAAALVPEDAFLYVEVASMTAVERLVRRLAGSIDPAMAAQMDAGTMLGQMLTMVGGDASKIDHHAPLALAVCLSPGSEPTLTLILPTDEPQQFARSLQMPPGFAEPLVKPGHVGITMGASYAVGATPPAIATDMPEGAVAARLRLQPVRPLLAPAIGQMRAQAQARNQATPRPGYMEGVDFGISLMEALEVVELAFDPAGDELGVSFAMEVAEGSSWELPQGTGADAQELSGYLAEGDTGAFLATWNQEFLDRTLRPALEQLASIGQANGDGPGPQAVRKVLGLAPLFGEQVVVSGRFVVGDARAAIFCRPAAPDALFDAFPTAFAALDIEGVQVQPLEREELEGGRAARTSIALPRDVDDPRMVRTLEGVELLFGSPSIDVRMASRDGHLALLIGGDEEWQSAQLDELGRPGGAPTGALREAFASVDGQNPCLAYRLDMLAGTRGLVTLMATQMGLDPGEDLAALEEALGAEPLWITAQVGVDGTRWSGSMRMDWERLMRLAELTGEGL